MKLLNKNVVITGGNQGFGLAVAQAFLKEGANVIICARDEEKSYNAIQFLDKFRFHSSQLYSFKADISKPVDNKELVQFALDKFKKIDILVANAGIYGPKGSIDEVIWDEWSHAIDINLKGTVLTCREVVSVMKKQRFGKIIILSGGGATKAMPFLSAYAVSKAAIVRFSDTLAEEVINYNVYVNSIAPGALNTRLLDEILESGPEKVGKSFYEQSLKQKETGGAPLEKGAELCVYLGSDESDGISGKLISAIWDPWQDFNLYKEELMTSDIYTLKRIIPEDRGMNWPLK
jgi:NAD(P)-dependent dehydrogenase (short-subunit alcohol dehydrogenase family)